MIVTTAQVAEIFDVSSRTILTWGTKGCPKLAHGKWKLRDVVHWWAENIHGSAIEADPGGAIHAAKTEYWQAKARNEKVKADIAENSVIQIDDFKESWVWRVSQVSTGLGAVPNRIVPLLVGKKAQEMRQIFENEIWKLRDNFSRTGKFFPADKKEMGGNERRIRKSI